MCSEGMDALSGMLAAVATLPLLVALAAATPPHQMSSIPPIALRLHHHDLHAVTHGEYHMRFHMCLLGLITCPRFRMSQRGSQPGGALRDGVEHWPALRRRQAAGYNCRKVLGDQVEGRSPTRRSTSRSERHVAARKRSLHFTFFFKHF